MASTFSNYSKEELLKKLKSQKIIAIVQAIVIFLMIIFAIFSTVENGISFQTFLPLFFAPMFFVMIFEVKKIKKELALRK
jgi:purine-cytosine permease-like protein